MFQVFLERRKIGITTLAYIVEEGPSRILPSRVEETVECEEAPTLTPSPVVVYRRGPLTSYRLDSKGGGDSREG